MSIKWYFILPVIIITSCVKEFDPKLDKFEDILVVDGMITNEQGPYIIKLSIASNTNLTKSTPVSNAKVTIISQSGEKEKLTEYAPGEYRTDKNGIRGKVGEKYKLSIKTSQRILYESKYSELREPTGINTIESKVEYHRSETSNIQTVGYQFNVTTNKAYYDNNYFLWFLEGTYKIKTIYPIKYTYAGYYRKVKNADTLHICYATYNINEVYTASTEGLSSNRIIKQPLTFIPGDDKKLEERYSLLVKQYSIDEDAYIFWKNIEKQSSSGSSLYTAQPFQIKGNIKNIYNKNEPVLGYFLVAGVSKKRIFVNRPPEMTYQEECQIETYKVSDFLRFSSPAEWPIYLTPSDSGLGMAFGTCIDCTAAEGSTTKKPYFWTD